MSHGFSTGRRVLRKEKDNEDEKLAKSKRSNGGSETLARLWVHPVSSHFHDQLRVEPNGPSVVVLPNAFVFSMK